MCGIVGYIGDHASKHLIECLHKLEYRGYDSAGIAVFSSGKTEIRKNVGHVSVLDRYTELGGSSGIAHTRWATHGGVTKENAHPHSFGKFTLVHNGIVENVDLLKNKYLKNEKLFSQTDSEVVLRLIFKFYHGNVLKVLQEVLSYVKGSCTLCLMCSDEPNVLYAVRRGTPLIVGKVGGKIYLSSDLPAIMQNGLVAYEVQEGRFVRLSRRMGIEFYDDKLCKIKPQKLDFSAAGDSCNKKNYDHFMKKEIEESPSAVRETIFSLETELKKDIWKNIFQLCERILIVGCGTAYHSGLCAKNALERLAKMSTEVFIASEFRACPPIFKNGDILLAISQSGETADTIEACLLAKKYGLKVIAVSNVSFSSINRIADLVLPTKAGSEIGVAATKSFLAQLAALYSLTLYLMRLNRVGVDMGRLRITPVLMEETLSLASITKEWAKTFAKSSFICMIGRSQDYCTALEGCLKMKEITYIPCDGYPSGELKHGTLALIANGTPVIAVISGDNAEKTLNAVHEVESRGGLVYVVTTEIVERKERVLKLPECEPCFSPILTSLVLQNLAYYTALELGNDPDKPRNLAKSVTVE